MVVKDLGWRKVPIELLMVLVTDDKLHEPVGIIPLLEIDRYAELNEIAFSIS